MSQLKLNKTVPNVDHLSRTGNKNFSFSQDVWMPITIIHPRIRAIRTIACTPNHVIGSHSFPCICSASKSSLIELHLWNTELYMLFIYYCMIYDEFHSLFDKSILIFLSFSHPTFAFCGCPERQTIQPLRRKHSHGPWHLRCAAKRRSYQWIT